MAKFTEAELGLGASAIVKNIMTYKTMADKARTSRRRDESKQLFQRANLELDKLKTVIDVKKLQQDQAYKKGILAHQDKILQFKLNNENSVENRQKSVQSLIKNEAVGLTPAQIKNLHIWAATDNSSLIDDILSGPQSKQPSVNDRSNLNKLGVDLQSEVHGVPATKSQQEAEGYEGGGYASRKHKPLSDLVKDYITDYNTPDETRALVHKVRNLQMLVSNFAKPENARWIGGSEDMALDQIERALSSLNTVENPLNPKQGRHGFMWHKKAGGQITDKLAKEAGQQFGQVWNTAADYEVGMAKELNNLRLMVKAAKGKGQPQQQQGQPGEQKVREGAATDIWNSQSEALKEEDQGGLSSKMTEGVGPRDKDQPKVYEKLSRRQQGRSGREGDLGDTTQNPAVLRAHLGEDMTSEESSGDYHFKPEGNRGLIKDVVDKAASFWNTRGGQELEIKDRINSIQTMVTSLERGEGPPRHQKKVFEDMMSYAHALGWPEPEQSDLRLSEEWKSRMLALLKKFTRKEIKAPTERRDMSGSLLKDTQGQWYNNINKGGNSGYQQNY
tara:strand:+ start:1119 stop:2795 length:1677 start_codon:yes stop_codon:yes gene_type:complete